MKIVTRSVLGLFLAMSMAACGGDDDDMPMIDSGGGGGPDAGGGGPTVLDVPMTAAEETPVCAMAGPTATGNATVTIAEDDSSIQVEVTYSGLSGSASAAHIHFGAVGQAGPPIFAFTDPASPINQTFTAADYPNPAPTGAPADFAAAVTSMKAGEMYINVHTDMCGGGEIRGQID